MRRRPDEAERAARKEARAAAREAKRTRVTAMRAWLEEREQAATKRAKAERKARLDRHRGVDRVPERLRVEVPETRWLVRHHDDPAWTRRARRAHRGTLGGWRRRPVNRRASAPRSDNAPHVNTGKDRSLAGKARRRAAAAERPRAGAVRDEP